MGEALPFVSIETKLVIIAKRCGFEVDYVEYTPALRFATIGLKRSSKISFDNLDALSRSLNTRMIEVNIESVHDSSKITISVSNLDLNHISALKNT